MSSLLPLIQGNPPLVVLKDSPAHLALVADNSEGVEALGLSEIAAYIIEAERLSRAYAQQATNLRNELAMAMASQGLEVVDSATGEGSFVLKQKAIARRLADKEGAVAFLKEIGKVDLFEETKVNVTLGKIDQLVKNAKLSGEYGNALRGFFSETEYETVVEPKAPNEGPGAVAEDGGQGLVDF